MSKGEHIICTLKQKDIDI